MEHPEIPSGHYCYSSAEVVSDLDGRIRLKTVPCVHWRKTETGARCNFIDEDHFDYCCWHLVWDQVKCCGQNVPGGKSHPADRTDWQEKETTCQCGMTVKYWSKKGQNEGCLS